MQKKHISLVLSFLLLTQNILPVFAQQTPQTENAKPQTAAQYRDRARQDASETKALPWIVGGLLVTGGIAVGSAVTTASVKRHVARQIAEADKRAALRAKNIQEQLEMIVRQQYTTQNKIINATTNYSNRIDLLGKQIEKLTEESTAARMPDAYLNALLKYPEKDLKALLPEMLKKDFPHLSQQEIQTVTQALIRSGHSFGSNNTWIAIELKHVAENYPFRSPVVSTLRTLAERIRHSKNFIVLLALGVSAQAFFESDARLQRAMTRLVENPALLLSMSDEEASLFEQDEKAKKLVASVSDAYHAAKDLSSAEKDFLIAEGKAYMQRLPDKVSPQAR